MTLYQIHINVRYTEPYKNSSTSKQGKYWTVCFGEVAHSALETIREGIASLNSNLELEEEDDPFNECDLEAGRTHTDTRSSILVHVLIFNAKNKLRPIRGNMVKTPLKFSYTVGFFLRLKSGGL